MGEREWCREPLAAQVRVGAYLYCATESSKHTSDDDDNQRAVRCDTRQMSRSGAEMTGGMRERGWSQGVSDWEVEFTIWMGLSNNAGMFRGADDGADLSVRASEVNRFRLRAAVASIQPTASPSLHHVSKAYRFIYKPKLASIKIDKPCLSTAFQVQQRITIGQLRHSQWSFTWAIISSSQVRTGIICPFGDYLSGKWIFI